MKYGLLIVAFLTYVSAGNAQNVGIGTTMPHASAILDITDSAKGLLIPRMSLAQRNAMIAPAKGLLVFVNTDSSFYYYNGTAWRNMQFADTTAWKRTGNAGTVDGDHFIGTTDEAPLNFRVNNQKAGRISVSATEGSTFLGFEAGNSDNLSDNQNTFIGFQAGRASTTGRFNTANGLQSLFFSTTGFYNTANGCQSLFNNATGSRNTANGYHSLFNNSSGISNTANGYQSLFSNTAGYSNTANGIQALYGNTTGSYNTGLGSLSDVASGNLTNATAIGAYALAATSNSLVLGSINGVNGAAATAKTGIGITAPQARLHVVKDASSATLVNSNSSALFDNTDANYVQLGSGLLFESGVISSTSATNFRSGLIFRADSSIQLRTGGNNTAISILQNGKVGIGTNTPGASLQVNGAIAGTSAAITVAGGPQTINPGNRSYIRIDNTNAAPATITLGDGVADGQTLYILASSSGGGGIQFIDNVLNNTQLNSNYLMGIDDTLTLLWDANLSKWIELHRSVN
jgi:trimeric autotransporter adhesin